MIPSKKFPFYFIQKLMLLACCLSLAACALRVPITGGPTDVATPNITKTIPANFSTNFTAKTIVIDFDEYIDFKDLSKQLIISPLMAKEPEISIKKKSIIIKLPDSLANDVTYTINFGDAIVDTHEGVALEDFQYVFATGNQLDSLEIKGDIKFAENLKTEKGIYALLYKNNSDTVVFGTLPDYYSKTNESGQFVIKNLKAGSYKLFALKDANNNYKFDSKSEAIGFSAEAVTIPDSTQHHLKLFVEPDTIPALLKAQYISKGKAIIVFTAPVNNFVLKTMAPTTVKTTDLIFEKSFTNDSVYVYCTDTLVDSLHAILLNGDFVIDTIHINLQSSKLVKGKSIAPPEGINFSTNLTGGILETSKALTFTFDSPLKDFKASQLQLTMDSITPIKFTLTAVDSIKKTYRIDFNAEENKSYVLLIPKGAAENIFNQTNDSITLPFKTREVREYASIQLTINSSEIDFNYLVQLTTEADVVLRQQKVDKNEKITFDYVLPAKYKIRLIYDTNDNGLWNSGSYAHKTQPEKVIYYPDIINTRANWDVELGWTIK